MSCFTISILNTSAGEATKDVLPSPMRIALLIFDYRRCSKLSCDHKSKSSSLYIIKKRTYGFLENGTNEPTARMVSKSNTACGLPVGVSEAQKALNAASTASLRGTEGRRAEEYASRLSRMSVMRSIHTAPSASSLPATQDHTFITTLNHLILYYII